MVMNELPRPLCQGPRDALYIGHAPHRSDDAGQMLAIADLNLKFER